MHQHISQLQAMLTPTIIICIAFCCPVGNKNSSLVCTYCGQQAKNIYNFCGQAITKEAKRITPIRINTVTEATIWEPICLDNTTLLSLLFSSTV